MINFDKRKISLFFVVMTILIPLIIFQYGRYLENSRLNVLLYLKRPTGVSLSNLSAGNGRSGSKNLKLQLNLPHCKIPKVPMYSHHYIKPAGIKFDSCENELKFSKLDKGVIQLEDIGLRSNCCVSEIVRTYNLIADTFEIRECIPFNKSTTMDVTGKEFIKVICKESTNSTTMSNFYANIIASADYLKKKTEYWNQKKEIPVNVLVLALDSTSRADAFRQLQYTMYNLLNEFNFIDFKGFHHLGEPTLVNAVPLLLGIRISKFFGKMKRTWTQSWDSSPFIWKEFNDFNFATAYIEDIPGSATFNYGGQTGFTYKPTDFYLRPFTLANNKPVCVGKTVIEKFMFDYQFEMLKKMNGVVPLFSLLWLNWPQHDYFDSLNKLENPILDFIQSIKNTPGLLENTVVFIMGDHSFRSGKYAESHEGLLERRLPLFLIRLPSKLISKHPEFLDRIKENSNRITSHYDVYKTLLHLAQLSVPGIDSVLNKTIPRLEQKFGKSLFEFIPDSRTCSDAGIPENNCACNLPFPLKNWSVKVPSIMKLKIDDIQSWFKFPRNDLNNSATD